MVVAKVTPVLFWKVPLTARCWATLRSLSMVVEAWMKIGVVVDTKSPSSVQAKAAPEPPPQAEPVPETKPLVSTWRQLLAVPVIEARVRLLVMVASAPTYKSPAPMVEPRVLTTSVEPRLNQPEVVALPVMFKLPSMVEEALLIKPEVRAMRVEVET